MTNSEFLSKLPEKTRIPTDKEFEVIQFVYDYHPSLSNGNGKEEIAMIYSFFGMRIIYDMMNTAKRAQKLNAEKRALQLRLKEIDQEYNEMAMAEENS